MKLAIVTPWFGRALKGGAEQLAWQVASRLAKRGHGIEVLTTCCRSHQDDWSINHFSPGAIKEAEGFTTRRFNVDPRDQRSFDRVCARLLSIPAERLKPGVSPIDDLDAEVFVNQLIRSQALIDYVAAHRENYQSFILLPYLYGPVLHSATILRDRAVLQPCLHDEAYAYLPQISQAFSAVGKVLFNSEGEKELALRLFGPGICAKSSVVGSGIETQGIFQSQENGASSSKTHGRFVLYLGRKESGKNVPLLVSAFERFKSVRPNSDLKLVLAGHGVLETNGCDSITDAGAISESEKAELLRHCVALVQPSSNESFSRSIMEAWSYGRPVVVQASCLATATAVRHSGGGWVAESEDDWAELFTAINRMSLTELSEFGRKGFDYASKIANWDKVIDRYEEALESAPTKRRLNRISRIAKQEIHQVLPNMGYGGAISNQALFIRNTLRDEGYSSNIYVRHVDPRVSHECAIFSPAAIPESSSIIYHHSVDTEFTRHVIAHPGPKFFIYHNITPAEFFEPYRPDFARILRLGRDELRELAQDFPISAGDSTFNAGELRESGFSGPTVLPIAIGPARWNAPPDPALMEQLQDGRTNILFVGRLAPNKKQDELIEAFDIYLMADPSARLILAGPIEENDPYTWHVQDLIKSKGLTASVTLAGCVDDARLAAYYRSAHLFWSMSEHEGFGAPLIEAMWFDVPALAFRSTAVPETLGEAGLMFTDKTDLTAVAALAVLLVEDVDLRQRIIQAQLRRRLHFLPEAVRPLVIDAVRGLVSATVSA